MDHLQEHVRRAEPTEPSGKWPHPTGWRWNKILPGLGWQGQLWLLPGRSSVIWALIQSCRFPDGLEQSWVQGSIFPWKCLLLAALSFCHLQRKHWEISSPPHFGQLQPVLADCESFKSAIVFMQWFEVVNLSFIGQIWGRKLKFRLQLGQKLLHTKGREGSKARGMGHRWQFQARALRICQTTLKPFLLHLTGTISQSQLKSVARDCLTSPTDTWLLLGSHKAPVLQGCTGVCHTQKCERHLVQKLKEATELKAPLPVAKYCFENVFGIHYLELK